jgi:hypothetical protein
MSGGERQRFALTRALLRDTPVIAIDEGTSALDYANESLYLNTLVALARRKVIIIVTHRLSSISAADAILVLDKNGEFQFGPVKTLLESNQYIQNFLNIGHGVLAWLKRKRPIERGIAGPGLLAHVLSSKYAEHTPLYRQSEIYNRQGVELSRSLLSGWMDVCCRLLSPQEEALQAYVLTDGKLHADDTPVPVLLPGNKKTKTGWLWTYVRDDRNAGSALAPAVWFANSPDRKGIHPLPHLAAFSGVLQADAYTRLIRKRQALPPVIPVPGSLA